MKQAATPSIRPAIKFAQGAVTASGPTSPRRTVAFDTKATFNTRKGQTTMRSGMDSVEEQKLESELIREAVDDLAKAVTAGGGAIGGGSNKALDSLYDIFSQIIVNPYVD